MDVARTSAGSEATADAGRKALFGVAAGWLFDGYETYSLILVGAIALRELLPADQLSQLPLYFAGLLAATLFGWATGGLISGILADYIGRKRMLMLTILCYAAFTGLSALAPSYGSLLVFRFLTGLGLGGEWGPGAALVGELWPPAQRGRVVAALQSVFGVGSVLAAVLWLVVGPLGEGAWRYMFVVGVLPALLVLYIRRGLEDPALWLAARQRRRAALERAAAGQALSAEEQHLVRFTLAHLFAAPELRRRLVLLFLMSLTTIVGYWAVSTWIPQYAGEVAARAGRDAQQWGAMAGMVSMLGSIVGYLTMGYLFDAWGRKPTIALYYAASLPAALIFFLAVRDPVPLLAAAAVNGFFVTGQFTWMAVYLPELFPTAVRASAMSFIFNGARYIAAFGPLCAGWVAESLGGISVAAASISLIYLLGLAVTPFAGPETKGQPLPE